jgi:hypothetical protein
MAQNANPCRPLTGRDPQKGWQAAVEPNRWLAMDLQDN